MRKVNVFLKLKSMIRYLTENKERKTTATKMVKIHDNMHLIGRLPGYVTQYKYYFFSLNA